MTDISRRSGREWKTERLRLTRSNFNPVVFCGRQAHTHVSTAVEVTELSTNKQHTHSPSPQMTEPIHTQTYNIKLDVTRHKRCLFMLYMHR